MKQMHIPRRLMLSASVAVVFAVAGLSASAQTTTSTTTTTSTATTNPHAGDLTTRTTGSATPQMIQEACQRQKARTAKFVQQGIPEQWGSEEPFTFDPNTPCS